MSDLVIERDTAHDAIGGSAGHMLLGMHLTREESVPHLDPLLHKLGDFLLKRSVDVDGTGWNMSPSARPLNGFGHGRAGVGMTLVQAGSHLNRSDLSEVGLAALKAEHEMRSSDPEAMGWPDLRDVEVHDELPTGPHMCAWCAGAEGIALSRAASLEYADDAFLQDDLEYAIECMKSRPPNQRLHLCCGEAGRTEVYRSIQKLTGNSLSSEISDSFSYFFANASNGPVCENPLSIGISLLQGCAGLLWAGAY